MVVATWPGTTVRVRQLALFLGFCASSILLAGLRIWTVHNVHYDSWFVSHGEAVLYSVVRITAGDTCLVEALPQYGCYGEFLAPFLRATGATTFAVTTIFAALQ